MRDLIWIAALAAALAGVWFFMARLDRLLRDSAQPPEEEAGLRLGVERGLDAAALRSVLGEVRLEFGTEQELRLALAQGRLDAVFLRSGQAYGALLLWRVEALRRG